MSGITKKIAVFLAISLIMFVAKTYAQEAKTPEKNIPAPASAQNVSVAADKTPLIKELFIVMEAKKSTEAISNAILSQVEAGYAQAIYQTGVLKDVKEDNELRNMIMQSQGRFSKRFKELYSQRINFSEILDKIYTPLYDKYFTEAELKDMIAFYKSPTGQKTIKAMPQLMQESMRQSNELMVPRIKQLVNELIEEEKNNISKELEAAKAKEQPKAQEPAKDKAK